MLVCVHTDYVDLFLVHWPVTNHPGPTLEPSMQVFLPACPSRVLPFCIVHEMQQC